MITRHHVPLKRLTTFQNQGQLSKDILCETVDDVRKAVAETDMYYVLGKGSNTVINDAFRGVSIRISPTLIEPNVNDNILEVSAGVPVNQLMKLSIEYGLSGLEFSAGVPATVGGMVTMNFGCWGHTVSDSAEHIYVLDDQGNDRWVEAAEMQFSYRSSRVQHDGWIVLAARFKLKKAAPEHIKQAIDDAVKTRLEKQPLKERTFGSVFKNPPQDYAARLIEAVGLKGYERPRIKVSEKHANFIVNTGDASYDDLRSLVDYIQKKVKSETGVQLELEVKLVS